MNPDIIKFTNHRIINMTNPVVPGEGFGSQFLLIVRSISLCNYYGWNFTYTQPNWTGIYDETEAHEINSMLNLTAEFIASSPHDTSMTAETVNTYQKSIDKDWTYAKPGIDKIKKCIRVENPFSDGFHVVIHIRLPSSNLNLLGFRVEERCTPIEYYLNKLISIREKYPNSVIHVLTDGNESVFDHFKDYDIVKHYNEPIVKSFAYIIYANVLVTSKSAFSYSAALLNTNEVHHKSLEPYLKPLPHWET